MKSPIDELLCNFVNTRSKIFIDDDIIIFFEKEDILKPITTSWFPMSRFKKLKDAEKKLKKRKITFYYYSQDQLDAINPNFKFNNEEPKFNELYFKLDDYNENITKYYTYDNFIRFSEDYNYDFFVYLFSYFGLKSMRWSYTNAHENIKQTNNNTNLGIKDQKIEFQFSTNETSKNYLGIEGSKNFENVGSIQYFDCSESRAFWYSYCKRDLETVVKELLDKSNRYSNKYYNNNELLQIRLENRLRGAKQICYEITNNTHHKLIVNKMIKISNKFANIGIQFNSDNVDTKNYTKKYSINFWDIQDLELKTLENILNNENFKNNNIDLNKVDKRFQALNNDDIISLDTQLELLQEKIKQQKINSLRLSKRDYSNTNTNKSKITFI